MSHVAVTINLQGREATITLPVHVTTWHDKSHPDKHDIPARIQEATRRALKAVSKESPEDRTAAA